MGFTETIMTLVNSVGDKERFMIMGGVWLFIVVGLLYLAWNDPTLWPAKKENGMSVGLCGHAVVPVDPDDGMQDGLLPICDLVSRAPRQSLRCTVGATAALSSYIAHQHTD